MNPEYADIELIERYLEGKLSSEESVAFEKRVQQDSSFAQQVEAQKISAAILEDYEFVQLKKQMQLQMRLETPSIPPRGKGGMNKYLLFIGATVILAVGGYFIFNDDHDVYHHDMDESLLRNEYQLPEELDGGPEVDKKEEKSIKKNNSVQVDTSDTKGISNIENNNVKIVADTVTTKAVNKIDKDTNSAIKDCSGLVIENTIEKGDACPGKNNGFVKIKVIKGGNAPYKFMLNTKRAFVSSGKFENLFPGEYYLAIRESSGCIVQLKEPVIIGTKYCKEPFNETFSPAQEGVWKLPIESGASAKIKFHNKAGLVIHEISVLNGMPSEWEGINLKGEETPAGYYYVTIEKSDGTMEYGYLTINR